MICVGVDLPSSRTSIVLAEQYEGIYSSVGLHPNDNLLEAYDESAYRELAGHPKVVAIGEIGLDYYRTTDTELKRRQRERFERQLELVGKTGKPAIIHCRDAHDDMLAMLRHRGVIHSFNGTAHQAARYSERGYMIGLNAIVTFSPDYREMVRSIPADRLVLETDAPYLAPAPHRGTRNEPVYILETARQLAELRGEDLEYLIATTTANARLLFSME